VVQRCVRSWVVCHVTRWVMHAEPLLSSAAVHAPECSFRSNGVITDGRRMGMMLSRMNFDRGYKHLPPARVVPPAAASS
jgi:hypothetical protein